jgi:DNA-binding HxlR family transcriptional regulator
MPGLEEGEGTRSRGSRARPACCPHLHEAVELVGRRWTGAILETLRSAQRPLRFSEIAAAIPDLSDRLLSERVKELEARGLVAREVHPGPPVRVTYTLTDMGHALEPALTELKSWAQAWLAPGQTVDQDRTGGRAALR